MAKRSKCETADLVERLARLQERLASQGRHREAGVVAKAMAEERGVPVSPAHGRGDLR